MSQDLKLDSNGNCPFCNKMSAVNEHVCCYTCKSMFHAVCAEKRNDDKLATKTNVINFLQASAKKKNFLFVCDVCLTCMETRNAEVDTQRINTLESKIGNMDKQLTEIKQLLTAKDCASNITNISNKEEAKQREPKSNMWQNKERLAKVKAPPVPSIVVLEKTEDINKDKENIELIEKIIMDHDIPLQASYRNQNGELTLLCDSKESRDSLINIVNNSGENIPTKSPVGKLPSITIVGLPKEYSKEEVVEMLVKQNDFINKFSHANNIQDHFRVLTIRPTKKEPTIFQVFATVSTILRDGLKYYNDKITLGLTSCKVYDRYYVKRCNNCQKFGHYNRDCPTPSEHHCGKCGEGHETRSCDSTQKKCINCIRNGIEMQDHCTFDPNCSSLLKQQNSLKQRLSKHDLNLQAYKTMLAT